ncbi:MAG: haloacid dehalogenase, partial [Pseudomonadaceae bacterium]|nr:haloacid dehalogenase [Pseudomonadaceae bacterium]
MPDWNTIDTVLLDMDGTLLDLHFDNHFWVEYLPRCYARKHGQSEQWARERIFPLMQRIQGQLDWYCLDFWTRELDLPIVELKRE